MNSFFVVCLVKRERYLTWELLSLEMEGLVVNLVNLSKKIQTEFTVSLQWFRHCNIVIASPRGKEHLRTAGGKREHYWLTHPEAWNNAVIAISNVCKDSSPYKALRMDSQSLKGGLVVPVTCWHCPQVPGISAFLTCPSLWLNWINSCFNSRDTIWSSKPLKLESPKL